MSIDEITAGALPRPAGHYSHATRAGGLVFVAGLLPVASDGRALGAEPFEVQVAQVLANLDEVLAAAGTSRAALVQVRVYITDVARWGDFNRLYAAWIGDRRPARCVVPVPVLHHGVLLEVEAIAAAAGG
ncbi:MAG: RidA family protein [Deltaproteobacteria bacterium]|nr:RidA family protein [Deltaproteobacteria bacterium]